MNTCAIAMISKRDTVFIESQGQFGRGINKGLWLGLGWAILSQTSAQGVPVKVGRAVSL